MVGGSAEIGGRVVSPWVEKRKELNPELKGMAVIVGTGVVGPGEQGRQRKKRRKGRLEKQSRGACESAGSSRAEMSRSSRRTRKKGSSRSASTWSWGGGRGEEGGG